MPLNILCTPYFSAEESIALERVAQDKGLSRSQVIRAAVAYFYSKCVPAQNEQSLKPASSFFEGVHPHN